MAQKIYLVGTVAAGGGKYVTDSLKTHREMMTVSHDSENMKPKIDLKHKFHM